jgi:N-acetylmuramoyl-L-alanine amidase
MIEAMGRKFLKAVVLILMTISFIISIPVLAQPKSLSVSYPPNNYKTKVNKVFFVGAAPLAGEVTINGKLIDRNSAGNFTPTLPLQEGDNNFSVRYQSEEVKIKIIKESNTAPIATPSPSEEGETRSNNTPQVPALASCGDIAAENTLLSTGGEPQAIYGAGRYLSCAIAKATGTTDQPVSPQQSNQPISVKPIVAIAPSQTQPSAAGNLEVAEVLQNDTIARTGPSSNYARSTPLLQGTKATVVNRQDGDNNGKKISWIQLDYGGWVNAADLKLTTGTAPQSVVRNVRSQNSGSSTDVLFPLQIRVPLVIEQTEKTLRLTLYNTTTPAESVKLTNNSVIEKVDSRSVAPNQVEYTFTYKSRQQWGYKYRYDGNNLVLSLRHAPRLRQQSNKPLSGIKILLDPGHGGSDSGAVGQNGYTEKEANLFAAKLLANELISKGATVYLTREIDKTVPLDERRGLVEKIEPTISLSIHYNSLPVGTDPLKVKGFSVFWYHSQAQGLAAFLHNYVAQYGDRPQYGVIWDNLALVRPAAAPSVLLELGFMSNPDEFQWISDPQAQQQMAKTLASGITQWFKTVN